MNNPQLDATITPNDPADTAEVNVPKRPEPTEHVPVTLACTVDTVPDANRRTANGCTIKLFVPSDDRSTAPTTVADANTPLTLDVPATALNVPSKPGVNSVGVAAAATLTVTVVSASWPATRPRQQPNTPSTRRTVILPPVVASPDALTDNYPRPYLWPRRIINGLICPIFPPPTIPPTFPSVVIFRPGVVLVVRA